MPVSGNEDCLYLNIYRPAQPKQQPLNVIVYIHGGGFHAGGNSPEIYGPDFFMESREVILVTIAHRLNVFGFLATGDGASPGNYGLKDQTMALRWIKENIVAFGGDPGAITLMGQSAGAVSAHYHLLSRHSEGLYKNVIMCAGSVNMPWALPMKNPREYVNAHARALGLHSPETLSSEELVEIFRTIPAFNLTAALQELRIWDILPVITYLPSVERSYDPDPFITVHPLQAMQSGQLVDVPVLNSVVPGDGINFVQPLLRVDSRYQEFNADIYRLLPVVLGLDPLHPNIREAVDQIRFKYLKPSGFVTLRNLDQVLEMASDYLFSWPYYKAMQSMARSLRSDLYGYLFNYRGSNSFSTIFTGSTRDFGVVHADDLLYLFRIRSFFPVQLSPRDAIAQTFFMRYILDFVKGSDLGITPWTTEYPRMGYFVNYDHNSTAIGLEMVQPDPMLFWDGIAQLLS